MKIDNSLNLKNDQERQDFKRDVWLETYGHTGESFSRTRVLKIMESYIKEQFPTSIEIDKERKLQLELYQLKSKSSYSHGFMDGISWLRRILLS